MPENQITDASLQGTHVQLAHEDEKILADLNRMCGEIGVSVIDTSASDIGLLENVQAKKPDLIITGMRFGNKTALDTLLTIADQDPLPAIIIARETDLADVEKAMEDHVMAYLVDPVDPSDLRATCYLVIKRFEQFQDLRKENAELKEALSTRKKLERAKGIVMEKYDLTEEAAYLKIRDVATTKRMKLSEVADIIIESVTNA